MSTTFPTPTTDAALTQLPNHYRRHERFAQAKEILSLALDANSIYNVDFNDAKNGVTGAYEAVLDAMFLPFRQKNRGYIDSLNSDMSESLWSLSSIMPLNHVPGRIKRTEKMLSRLPDLQTYLDIFREALQFTEAFEKLKPVVIKGRKPLENPKPVDLTNLGTCAICQHMQKLTAGKKMVHHGFQISNGSGHYFGFRSGKCFGTGRTPYELSCQANQDYIVVLQGMQKRTEERLAELKANTIDTLYRTEQTRQGFGRHATTLVEYKRGDEKFERVREIQMMEASSQVAGIKSAIEQQEFLVKNWTPKALKP